MKLYFTSCLLTAAAKTASAIPATTDIYYHEQLSKRIPEAMWIFSAEGVAIYSPDGRQRLKSLTADDLDCGESCFYFDVVTDGRRYVLANALHSTPNRVDVFSIETGDYLGGVATCSTPLDLDYLPNRDELWVRCAGSSDSSHLNVFPLSALTTSALSEVRLTNSRSYGYAVFHSSLGNFGYATVNDANVLYRIDLAHRETVANFTLDNAHSAYDMTYSPANKHIFLRSRVCCTCGFDSADAPSCGRFGGTTGLDIQTGPSAGRNDLNGTCGVGCEGSLADTIGVMEFDTVSLTFVANHQPLVGYGATPEASPDGRYVVLFANDGGQNLRVLRAGSNGEPSTVAFDVPVNFENVPPGREAISDFAFVNWRNHDILALASGYDNHLAVVDLSSTSSTPTVTKILLTSSDSPTGGNGGRMVEWAYGSDYVWVDGSSSEEAYVLALRDGGTLTVERAIPNIPSSHMIYVENFAQEANLQLFMELLTSDGSEDIAQLAETNGDDSNDDDSLMAVVALVIASVSLLINGIFGIYCALYSTTSDKHTSDVTGSNTTGDKGDDLADERTLGSKHVA